MSAEKPYSANVHSGHLRAAALAAQAASARPSSSLRPDIAESIAEALLETDENRITIMGTNGHRAAIAAIAADGATGPPKTALLSTGETTRLAALLIGTDGMASIDLRTEAGVMSIQTPEHSLEVLLNKPCPYPDVLHRLARESPSATARLHPAALSAALRETSGQVKIPLSARDPVYLRAGENGITVRNSHTKEQKTVPAKVEGYAEVALGAGYLTNALQLLSGGATVKIHGPEDPVEIRSAAPGPPSLTQYLMPVRTRIEFK